MFWLALLAVWQAPNVLWLYFRMHGQPLYFATDNLLQIRLTDRWYPSISNYLGRTPRESGRAMTLIPMSWLSPWQFSEFIQFTRAAAADCTHGSSSMGDVKGGVQIAGQRGLEIAAHAGDKETSVVVPELCLMVSAPDRLLFANVEELKIVQN